MAEFVFCCTFDDIGLPVEGSGAPLSLVSPSYSSFNRISGTEGIADCGQQR